MVGAVGCGDDDGRGSTDAGPDAGAMTDADVRDDAGEEMDAEMPMLDADVEMDAGSPEEDAGSEDGDGGTTTDDAGTDGGGMMVDSCMDGVRSGDETGVDCGGETCEARCDTGGGCAVNGDCASGVCIGATCQAPNCSDGIRNGDETGRDCGGDTCDPCGLGEGCVDEDDCADAMCVDMFCVADHCFDGERNVNESDVDCGGPDCAPCAAGLVCRLDRDCMMGTCVDGFCRTAACTNEMLDMGEVDVDCGGECPGCPDGTACTLAEDCLSERCDMGTCTSCEDDTLNGDETDVDCGGSLCRRCFGGEACVEGSDCTSGLCMDGVCEGGGVFYEEDFGAGDGGWTTGGTNSSWEYAAPMTATIDGAFTGTDVWVTNATGDYNNGEDSWVESPTIDLSGAMADPLLEIAIFHLTESCCDEGWVEVSTDDGATWEKVVDDGTAVNWYNDTTNDWFDGDVTEWFTASVVLTGTAGSSTVKVRFFFDSDGSFTDEGFAFDDVVIREDVCNNGVLDAAEADVDCGGECGPCPDSSMCVMDVDCASMRCDGGECTSCRDGIQNGDEEAIDCGGSCGLCPGGTACTDGTLCASGECVAGVCTNVDVYYETDFEGGEDGWTADSLWEYGMPAATVIDSAASGTSAWVTNLTGDYPSSADASLTSPSIDLSAAVDDPVISFSLNYDTENCCDEGWLEVSIDGGTTWTKVLGDAGATGWYDDTSSNEWDGSSEGWITSSAILEGTAREPDVRVRFRFTSDGSVQNEGFAVDDVRIAPPSPDLAVSIDRSPDLCAGGVVTVTNVGSAPVTFFDLTTVVDGSMTTSRITTALDPGESFDAEVAAMTSLEATVAAAGDDDPSNDSAMFEVPMPIELGTRYLETFEMDDGGWFSYGVNDSWEYGEPSDSFISNADSGTNAWVTDLNGDHADDELSYLVSPCFDLSGTASDPEVSFSRIFDLEPTNDHVHVEISVDGGATWEKLGAFGTGTNWYNDVLGDFWDGVSGASGEWRRASHPLVGAAGAGLARIRFVMESNGSTNEEGFGLDDVIITP
ncbi:MAG: hypothetical protein CMN29_28555 [Sandaracinus sp.]|nr:hypothetical protein [Myxococcales bacterium]MAT28867.1 hypothetical protein [Sandaracinus sp.]